MLMIISGFIYLAMQYNAGHYLQNYTLQQIWNAAAEKEIAEAFGSITLILAYFRILDYLTLWQFLGVLIITIFKMLFDIAKFLIVFLVIVIGFAAGFHLSYSGTGIIGYKDFPQATLTTFLSSPTGYSIPDAGTNVLGFVGPYFGLFCQVLYVFIGIVLLLNLLIALMSETYEIMREQATMEYRWLVSQPFKEEFFRLWPSPLNILHIGVIILLPLIFVFYLIGWFFYALCCEGCCACENDKEGIPQGLAINQQHLNSGMIINYFKATLEPGKFKEYLVSENNKFEFKDKEDSKGKRKD